MYIDIDSAGQKETTLFLVLQQPLIAFDNEMVYTFHTLSVKAIMLNINYFDTFTQVYMVVVFNTIHYNSIFTYKDN